MKNTAFLPVILATLIAFPSFSFAQVSGNDEILEHIEKNQFERASRGQFETENERNRRVAQLSKQYSVLLPIADYDNGNPRATFNYDMDSETVALVFRITSTKRASDVLDQNAGVFSSWLPVFILSKKESKHEHYMGQNNFGAKALVSKWSEESRGILVLNLDTGSRSQLAMQVKMPRELAKELFANAAWRITGTTTPVLTAGTLPGYYLVREESNTEPSMKYKIDVTRKTLLAPFKISKIELINLKSKGVVASFDVNP